jgi:hypothetical protein
LSDQVLSHYNDLLSFKAESHKSGLLWNQFIVTMEKTLD